MSGRPSGTVTFLFTDVAGSTRLWESDRAGMERSLADHDRILRDAIEAANGIVFATGGDSFSAAFPTAPDALEAALTAQRALESHDWRGPPLTVRMGIHTGVVEERGGDYFGPAVNRAARIMAVGQGRQTLLSDVTAGLVQDRIEAPLTLVDLGVHALKDLERPEHLYEVRHPDLPVVTTPLASRSALGGSHLPEQLTRFIGRSEELATVIDLISGSRLVTLTGAGGTGKTRLALEAADTKAGSFADGAWMAELSSITDASLVVSAIADVWDLRAGEGVTLAQVLSTFVSTRELLLVVDNCEHVLEPVTSLLTDLLHASPGLTILATSRESLGVPGEAVFRVPSMSLPETDQAAETSDAVALFLDRVHTARPDYSPTADDVSAIIAVCRRLDGIPLGLELAAARLRTMTPRELADRLDHSLSILGAAQKGSPSRQRTLQATIEWSYDLLEPTERSAFRRASCFVGGFDLEAASAVVASSGLADWEVLDIIDHLVDKSLLTATLVGGGTRFRMLEPIREYAHEKLSEEKETHQARADHADYYARFVANLAPKLRGPDQKVANQTLRSELDNIRRALSEFRDDGRLDDYLQTSFDLALFWSQAALQAEALEGLLDVLESQPAAHPEIVVKGWWTASMLAFNLTDPASVDYGLQGLAIAETLDDDISIGWMSAITGAAISGTTSRGDSDSFFLRAKELVPANLDHAWWNPDWDLAFLGWEESFVRAEDPEGLMADLAGNIDAAKALGDGFLASGLMAMSFFLRSRDDDPRVLAYLEESVRILVELGFRHSLGHALLYWGWLTRDREGTGTESGSGALASGAEMLAEVGDISCAVRFTSDLVGHLLTTQDVTESIPHLAFMARQASNDASRFAPLVTRVACRAAAQAGDLEVAAVILGQSGRRDDRAVKSPFDDCRALVEAGLTERDREERMAKGSQMNDLEILDFINTWAGNQ